MIQRHDAATQPQLSGCNRVVIKDAVVTIACLITAILLQTSVFSPNVQGFFKDDRDIGYPSAQDNQTFGVPELIVLAHLVPILIIIFYNLFLGASARKWYLLNQLLMFLTTIFLNEIVTNSLKLMVGRLRPDFLDRCKPNYALFPPSVNVGYVADPRVCQGSASRIAEGRKSFPSGHSSNIMCGMVFLALFMHRAIPHGIESSHLIRVTAQVLCITTGLVVAGSRVYDHMHHPSDVIIGSIIGIVFGLVPFLVSNHWYGEKAFPTGLSESQEKVNRSVSGSMSTALLIPEVNETSDL